MPDDDLNEEPDATQGLLGQIHRLMSSPVGPISPLGRAGALLSGFGAGVQGRPNPIMADAMAAREHEFTRATALAQLQRSLAAEQRMQASAKFKHATDLFHIQTTMTNQTKTLAEMFPERPELMEQYLTDLSKLGGHPLTPEGATRLAADQSARHSYEKYLGANVLFALTGDPLPAGIPPVISPQVQEEIRTNPVKKEAWLELVKLDKLAHVTDPSKLAELSAGERAKVRWETAEHLAKEDALRILSRTSRGDQTTVPLTAAHVVAAGVADPEKLGLLMNLLEAEGLHLDPSQRDLAKAHREAVFAKGLPAEARLAVTLMGLPPTDPRKRSLQEVLDQMSDPFKRNTVIAASTEIAKIQMKRHLGTPLTLDDHMKLQSWEEFLRSTKGEVFMVLRKAFADLPDSNAPPFSAHELGTRANAELVEWAKRHGTRNKAMDALSRDTSISADGLLRARRAISTAFPTSATPPMMPRMPTLPSPSR